MANTQLVDYGIYQEDPDIERLHVSYQTKRVYAFKVGKAIETLEHATYREVKVKTGNVVTAVGKLVPPKNIPGLKSYDIPKDLMPELEVADGQNTTTKGNAAVQISKTMISRGIIPIKLEVKEVTNIDLQIKGLDICVENKVRFQVKCDWTAGPKAWGGSGNLFIQTQECNPLGMH